MRRPTAWLCIALCALACENDPVAVELVPMPERFIGVAVGHEHSCGLSPNGKLFCWGSNEHGQLGGDTTRSSSTIPLLVRSTAVFAQVSGGAKHTCALDASGAAYCWGANERGQLGTGDRVRKIIPAAIAPTQRFAQISTGAFHTCAVTSDRRMFCWGAGDHGGTGSTGSADVLTPQELDTPIRFVAVAAGGAHTCAIDTGAIAHCWGKNDRGQLGDASFFDRRLPGRPVFGDGRYQSIDAGMEHTCALRTDDRPVCWGSNVYGELGEGAPPSASGGAVTPFPVRLDSGALGIAAGSYASCLVDTGRSAWCWGRGSEGQLGYGGRFDYHVPQRVNDPDLSSATRFARLSIGMHHVCGLTSAETIYCWGRGDRGQLGAGSLLFSSFPIRVVTGS